MGGTWMSDKYLGRQHEGWNGGRGVDVGTSITLAHMNGGKSTTGLLRGNTGLAHWNGVWSPTEKHHGLSSVGSTDITNDITAHSRQI